MSGTGTVPLATRRATDRVSYHLARDEGIARTGPDVNHNVLYPDRRGAGDV
jgi:hypothetical protein